MKTLLLFATFSLFAADPQKSEVKPAPSISETMKAEYWKSRALVAEGKLRQQQMEQHVNAIADAIAKSCPAVKLDDNGDIVCPKAEVPATPKQ